MAEVTQEVKARLTVEADGEPEAFNQAAAGIQELASTASSGAEPAAQMAEELARMAESAQELGPVAQGAVREFADAIKEASKTDGLQEQAAALKQAAAAWKTFGEEAKAAGELPAQSLKTLDATIKTLERTSRELAAPLVKGAREASEALDKVEGSAKKGFDGATKHVASARKAIDEYKKSLEAAKAAGQNVTAGQEAELARLEARYNSTVQSIGRFRAEEAAAKKEIDAAEASVGKQVTSVNSLGDILAASGPKWATFVQGAGLVVGAFTAGYAAGEKLRAGLNYLTDGGFDRATQGILRMSEAAEKFVGSADTMADRIRLLANQKNIFEGLGLEGFSNDLEKNQRLLNEHALGIKKNADALDEFSRKIGLNREELDKQSVQLAKNITAFAAANKQIGQGDFAAIFKKPIQELLDSYAKLGTQVPGQLASIAAAWNISTTAAENAATKTEAVASRILAAITGVAAKSSAELATEAAGIEKAFSQIKLPALDTAQFDKARAEIAQVIGDFTAAGVAIPKSLGNIAAQYLVYQDQVGLAVSAVDKVAPSAAGASAGLIELKKSTADAGTAAADLGAKSGTSADGLIKWSASADKAGRSARELGAGTVEVTRSLDGTRFSLENTSPTIDELMEKYGGASDAALDLSQAFTAQGAAATAAGAKALQAAGGVEGLTTAMGEAAGGSLAAAAGSQAGAAGFQSAASAAAGAKEPITSAAAAIGQAGEKAAESAPNVAKVGTEMQTAAGSTEGMSQAAKGVTFAPAVGELDALSAAVKATATSVHDQLINAFILVSSKAGGFSGPILAELQKIIDKAGEAKAALESVEA